MIYDQYDAVSLQMRGAISGVNTPIPTAVENFRAARRNMLAVESPLSRNFELEAIWGPIIEQINETIGDQYRATDNPDILGAFPDPTHFFGSGLRGNSEELYQGTAQRVIDQVLGYEEQNPGSFEPEFLQALSLDALEQQARDNALAAREDYMEVIENSRGTGGVARFAGELAGGLYEATRDPLQFAAIGLGGSGNLARFAFQEFLLNAGIEVMRQPGVAEWYGELGLEYTAEDFFRNVTVSAVAGTGFAVGLRYGGRAIGRGAAMTGEALERLRVGRDVSIFTRALDQAEPNPLEMLSQAQIREGIERMEAVGARNSSDGQAAFQFAEMMEEDRASNPGFSPADHLRNLETSSLALAAGRVPEGVPELGPDILSPAVLEQNQNDLESLGGVLYAFDPRQIEVDAATFQFKAGGDEFGVTDRLRFVTEWDPQLAGIVTVYEYADGRLFIADGHQRVGLARRLMAQDPSLNIQLFGYRIREVDGITPQEAMVTAAITNIAQGTGTVIDAAKIARMNPDRFEGLVGRTLAPNSALVRQARDMMALSQDAFGAIINEVIDARYGAIVGRILADMPELQMPAIGVLNKADPANVVQAEAIVRQIRDADADVATQQSLFGDEMVVESLYAERARVLDRAIKQLRQDRAAFASLTRNAEEIEQAGNALNRETNQRRAQTDAEAISLIQTLANRKGPLSDALSAAARLARDSGQYATPTRQFVESVRRAIADGDFEGVDGGTVGSRVYDTPPSRRAEVTEEPSLAGFEEPTGHGPVVEQQLDGLTREMFPEEAAPPAARAEEPLVAEAEIDPDMEIPSAMVVDPETGEISMTMRAVKDMLDEEDSFIDRLGYCTR